MRNDFENISTTITIREMKDIICESVEEVARVATKESGGDTQGVEMLTDLLLKYSATIMAKMFVIEGDNDRLEII